MNKNRLEAFSDGVMAIIITIMVLDLHAPHEASLAALRPLLGVFLSYVLSFTYVGIYWNNHHHLLSTLESINGRVMWANLHLLFWLSLLPFATSWVGNCGFARVPSALYGVVLFVAAIAYWLLQKAIMSTPDGAVVLRKAVGRDWKGKLSPVLYLTAIASNLWSPWIAQAIYALGALIWVVPDRRIARALKAEAPHDLHSDLPDLTHGRREPQERP
ncbi:MAG TPA: TMEM175 family protein [Oscillatoriaceae cyanobacterium]